MMPVGLIAAALVVTLAGLASAQERALTADPVALFDLADMPAGALVTVAGDGEGPVLGVSVLDADQETRLWRKLLLDKTAPVRFLHTGEAAFVRATAIPGGSSLALMTVSPPLDPLATVDEPEGAVSFSGVAFLEAERRAQCVFDPVMAVPPFGLSVVTAAGEMVGVALYDPDGVRISSQSAETQLDLARVDVALSAVCVTSAAGPAVVIMPEAQGRVAPEPDVAPSRLQGVVLDGDAPVTVLLGPRDEDRFFIPADSQTGPFDLRFDGLDAFVICTATPARAEACVAAQVGTLGPFPPDEDLLVILNRTEEWEQPVTLSLAPTAVVGRDFVWALAPDPARDVRPAEAFRVAGRLADNQRRTVLFTAGETAQLWRFAISGGGISRVTLSSTEDAVLTRRHTPAAEQRIVLQDLLLQPGQYALELLGTDEAAFRIIGRPLGPAPADDEQEPNDESPRLLTFGETVRGRMPEGDRDSFLYFARRPMTVEIVADLPPGLVAEVSSTLGSTASHPDLNRQRGQDRMVMQAEIGAGLHELRLQGARSSSPEDYRLTVSIVNPFADQVAGLRDLDLRLETVAAHRLFSQRLSLTGAPEGAKAEVWLSLPDVRLEQTADGPALVLPPDVPVNRFQGFALFRGSAGAALAGGAFELESNLFAAPVDPLVVPDIPAPLVGSINVVQTSLGARLVDAEGYAVDPETGDIVRNHPSGAREVLKALDGVTAQSQPPVNHRAVLARDGPGDQAISPVVALAGDAVSEIIGVGIATIDRESGALREFSVDVSIDGQSWQEVLTASHTLRDGMAIYPFDRPFQARFVRFRPRVDAQADREGVWLNAFEVYADPLWSGVTPNLLDPALGAVAHRGVEGDPSVGQDFLLAPDDTQRWLTRPTPDAKVAPVGFVWSFNRTRTALVARIEMDFPDNPRQPMPTSVVVEGTAGDALGPWSELATLVPEVGKADATLATPQNVRLLRLSLGFADGEDTAQLPNQIRAYPAPPTAEVPSVLGLPQAWDVPGLRRDLPVAGPQARGALATDGEIATGQLNLGQRTETWTVSGQEGANTVEVVVSGSAGFQPQLEATLADGAPRAPREVTGAAERYVFDLAPDEVLSLALSEPQRSTVFLIDTSPSVAPFVPQIRQSIQRFADTMIAGEDVVQFGVLGRMDVDQPWVTAPEDLQRRLSAPLPGGTSDAEGALITAAEALRDRAGSRAVVLISDADSGLAAGTLDQLAMSRARVFTIKMSSGGMWQNPAASQPLSLAWAGFTGGEVWPVLRPEIDIAAGYARATARLLGPKRYDISATASMVALEPGGLLVEGVPNPSDAAVPTGRVLHILLDTSGSMLARQAGGMRRITLAKVALQGLLQTPDVADAYGLRVFGGPPEQCLTDLVQAPQDFEAGAFATAIDGVAPKNLARTPIAAALRAAGDDLAGIADRAAIVLITDGEETCDGDPLAEIARLREAGIETRIDVVSFALADEVDRAPFRAWADAGNGSYTDVADGVALSDVLQAVAAPQAGLWQGEVEVGRFAVGETVTGLAPGDYELRFDDGQRVGVTVAVARLAVVSAQGVRQEAMDERAGE